MTLESKEIGFMTTAHSDTGIFAERGDIVAWSATLFQPESKEVGEVLAATELAATAGDLIVFNIMDVSVVRLIADVLYTPFLTGRLRGVKIGRSIAPQVGDEVFKIGAATGTTEGRIVNVQMQLSIPRPGNPAWMKGIFEVEGNNGELFSKAGDSGAIILKRTGDTTADAVGMIFAGAGRTTYAFPLQPVLESFRCRLFDGSAG